MRRTTRLSVAVLLLIAASAVALGVLAFFFLFRGGGF
jgi:hypothetical protein